MHGYQKFIFNKHKQRKKYDQHKGENKSSIHPLLTKHLLDRLSKANEMTGPTALSNLRVQTCTATSNLFSITYQTADT